MPHLELRDVSLTFGSGADAVEALHKVGLQVAAGEFVSIVGESGCGKTTLLRVVAGLVAPTSGVATVSGKPVKGPPDSVGFVFQRSVLLPWRRIIDNVLLPLQLAGTLNSTSRQEALAALELVGIRDFAYKFPRQLSGGMQQRASIARTLVTQPSLLLMDEPFGALDAITRERLNLDLLDIWAKSQCTCLFITHDIDEAIILSDRVVLMSPRPGRIRREFTVDLPRPRVQSMRYTPEFTALSRQIHREMTREAEVAVA